MANEAVRVPIELRDNRFVRTTGIAEFARFLLETELGSYRPDPEFGCRSPQFTPEYYDDLKVEVRNHVLRQFRQYLGLVVNVSISDNVSTPTATFVCRVTGTGPGNQRFDLSWEI
ncbi:MAG: hypothetical protein IT585_01055 [candidate division Zixibacteria bacterium]|nr:hypothetical protein [candidate division Zixibacteria bacterium]